MMLVEMHRKADEKDNEKCNNTATIHLKDNSTLRYSDTPLKCYDNDRSIISDDDKRNTISIKPEDLFKSIFTSPFTKEKTVDEK